jgi:hypothetical protein
MDIVFSGGNADQQALWREALENLLNLPLDALPLTQHVSFVGPSEVDPAETASTPFAATYWAVGAGEGEVKVRNDAPGFGDDDAGLIGEAQGMGLTYDARRHFHETAAHETGHCVFAVLPEEIRLKIAGLLGAKTITNEELYPPDAPWTDRVGEAIAETFKEAFLPSGYRVFPNRTNIRLSYARYPLFRRLVREGIRFIAGVARLGIAVPDYDNYAPYRADPVRVGGSARGVVNVVGVDGNPIDVFPEQETEPYKYLIARSEGHLPWSAKLDDEPYLDGEQGLFSPYAAAAPDPEKGIPGRAFYWAYSDTREPTVSSDRLTDGLLLKPGTQIEGSFFLPSSREFYREAQNATDELLGVVDERRVLEGEVEPIWVKEDWSSNSPFRFEWLERGARAMILFTYWDPAFEAWVFWPGRAQLNNFSGAIVGANWSNFGTGEGWSINRFGAAEGMALSTAEDGQLEEDHDSIGPVKRFDVASSVPEGAPTIETCNGPMVKVRIMAEVNLAKDPDMGATGFYWNYEKVIWPLLPSFVITEPGDDCGAAPIGLPSGKAEAAGRGGGKVNARQRIQGHHGGAVSGSPLPPIVAATGSGCTPRTFMVPALGGGTVDAWRPGGQAVDHNGGSSTHWFSEVPIVDTVAFATGQHRMSWFIPYPPDTVTAMQIEDRWQGSVVGFTALLRFHIDVIARSYTITTLGEFIDAMWPVKEVDFGPDGVTLTVESGEANQTIAYGTKIEGDGDSAAIGRLFCL